MGSRELSEMEIAEDNERIANVQEGIEIDERRAREVTPQTATGNVPIGWLIKAIEEVVSKHTDYMGNDAARQRELDISKQVFADAQNLISGTTPFRVKSQYDLDQLYKSIKSTLDSGAIAIVALAIAKKD